LTRVSETLLRCAVRPRLELSAVRTANPSVTLQLGEIYSEPQEGLLGLQQPEISGVRLVNDVGAAGAACL